MGLSVRQLGQAMFSPWRTDENPAVWKLLVTWPQFRSRKTPSWGADPSPHPVTGHFSVSLRYPGLAGQLPLFPCLGMVHNCILHSSPPTWEEWSKPLEEEGKEMSHSRSWHYRCHSYPSSPWRWRVFLGTCCCLPCIPAQRGHYLIPCLPHKDREWEVGLSSLWSFTHTLTSRPPSLSHTFPPSWDSKTPNLQNPLQVLPLLGDRPTTPLMSPVTYKLPFLIMIMRLLYCVHLGSPICYQIPWRPKLCLNDFSGSPRPSHLVPSSK